MYSAARILPALILLGLLSPTEARPKMKPNKWESVSRQVSESQFDPTICKRATLDPSIDCGCFEYAPLYLRDPKWKQLKILCIKRLYGRIWTGLAKCKQTSFASPTGGVYYGKMDYFFYEASRTCIYTSSTTSRLISDSSTRSPVSSLSLLTNEMGPRKTPSSLVSNVMTLRDENKKKPRPSSKFPSIYRIERRSLHRRLGNFCLVVGFARGISRERLFDMCCPGY